MPMTMREKMARAMAEKDGKEWAPMSERFRDAYYDHADAALSALAEPTEAMIIGAINAYEDVLADRGNDLSYHDIFRAMIAKAGDD